MAMAKLMYNYLTESCAQVFIFIFFVCVTLMLFSLCCRLFSAPGYKKIQQLMVLYLLVFLAMLFNAFLEIM